MREMVKVEKKTCCGCGACAVVCPVGAITMQPDEEGFLYPVIEETVCIHCDACRRVCGFGLPRTAEEQPQSKNEEQSQPAPAQKAAGEALAPAWKNGPMPACFAARKTNNDHLQSRSGGAFAALAEAFLAQGGIVYGAALEPDGQTVRHRRITQAQALKPLRGSKYLQSEAAEAIAQAKEDLIAGKTVLFSGMPCQIDGLHRLLEQKRISDEKLYTCDLVCHGVPSPAIWQANVADLTQKYGAAPEAIQFRDKRMGWRAHIESYIVGGKKHFSNRFTQLYGQGLITRPACAQCSYCSVRHPADLTISDGWNVKAAAPEWDDNTGVSSILVQTEKGEKMLALCAAGLETRPVPMGYQGQPNLTRPSQPGAARADFWALYREKGYAAAKKKYASSYKERIKIPYNLLKNPKR